MVLATVTDITRYGAYVALDEYGGMRGFLHVSEISTGWVRHIDRYVKLRQKAVLKVIRVNRERREVDLSLRQVGGEERKSKLIAVKRAERAASILELLKAKLNLGRDEYLGLSRKLVEKFNGTYEALETVVRQGPKAWEDLGLKPEQLTTAEAIIKEKITIPTVSIRGVLEARSNQPDGIEVIRQALSAAESVNGVSQVEVKYVGAPRYRITVTSENYKSAEKVLENAVQTAKSVLEKAKGALTFKRE